MAEQQKLHYLQLKIKYLLSVVQLRKQTKISELEKKLTDHVHDQYITTAENNTLAADVFNARLAQEHLITKTDFDAKLLSLNKKNYQD